MKTEKGFPLFAHDAMVRFGHAIRVARSRRPHATGHELGPSLVPVLPARVRHRRAIAAVLTLAAAVAVVFLYRMPAGGERGDTGSQVTAVTGQVAIPTALPLRGRSDVVVATVPSSAPAPTTAPAPSGNGTSTGGSGNGAGGGGGLGTPFPTPVATPSEMILDITVFDARTHRVLSGVCVIDGLTTCTSPGAAITDANGHATLRLSTGQLWHLEFQRTGYKSSSMDVFSNVASQSIVANLTPSQ